MSTTLENWQSRAGIFLLVSAIHLGALWGVRQQLNRPPEPKVLMAEILVEHQAQPMSLKPPELPSQVPGPRQGLAPPRKPSDSPVSEPQHSPTIAPAPPLASPTTPRPPLPAEEQAARPSPSEIRAPAVSAVTPGTATPATLPAAPAPAVAAAPPAATPRRADTQTVAPPVAMNSGPGLTRPVAVIPAPGPAASQPERIELPSTDAQHLTNAKPAYPALSKRLGEQGRVVVNVLIGTDGEAQKVELLQSSGFERLDQSALATALRWRYLPGKKGGVPQTMWYRVPINFVIE